MTWSELRCPAPGGRWSRNWPNNDDNPTPSEILDLRVYKGTCGGSQIQIDFITHRHLDQYCTVQSSYVICSQLSAVYQIIIYFD